MLWQARLGKSVCLGAHMHASQPEVSKPSSASLVGAAPASQPQGPRFDSHLRAPACPGPGCAIHLANQAQPRYKKLRNAIPGFARPGAQYLASRPNQKAAPWATSRSLRCPNHRCTIALRAHSQITRPTSAPPTIFLWAHTPPGHHLKTPATHQPYPACQSQIHCSEIIFGTG